MAAWTKDVAVSIEKGRCGNNVFWRTVGLEAGIHHEDAFQGFDLSTLMDCDSFYPRGQSGRRHRSGEGRRKQGSFSGLLSAQLRIKGGLQVDL